MPVGTHLKSTKFSYFSFFRVQKTKKIERRGFYYLFSLNRHNQDNFASKIMKHYSFDENRRGLSHFFTNLSYFGFFKANKVAKNGATGLLFVLKLK